MIKKIKVQNFKSFRELDLELRPFNVVIGANASGKSNFVKLFRFLKDLSNDGLENAVSLQGGAEYLTNLNIGLNKDFSLDVITDIELDNSFDRLYSPDRDFLWKINKEEYNLVLRLNSNEIYTVITDKMILNLIMKNALHLSNEEQRVITFINKNGKIESDIPIDLKLHDLDLFPEPRNVLLQRQSGLFFQITRFYKDIQVYRFEPSTLKKITSITSKKELEEDGSNLAAVLNNIFKNKADKSAFLSLVNDILNFVEDVNIGKSLEKSLVVNFREKYIKGRDLPSFLLSDGTVYITALITAIYYTEKSFLVFEEVDKSIHPYIVSRLIKMLKEVSKEKQIVITTHNPEVLKYVDLEDIFLISRDEEGFSVITKPNDREDVKVFLENNLGIQDLFVDGILK